MKVQERHDLRSLLLQVSLQERPNERTLMDGSKFSKGAYAALASQASDDKLMII